MSPQFLILLAAPVSDSVSEVLNDSFQCTLSSHVFAYIAMWLAVFIIIFGINHLSRVFLK